MFETCKYNLYNNGDIFIEAVSWHTVWKAEIHMILCGQ
jgi:hypothetical protein